MVNEIIYLYIFISLIIAILSQQNKIKIKLKVNENQNTYNILGQQFGPIPQEVTNKKNGQIITPSQNQISLTGNNGDIIDIEMKFDQTIIDCSFMFNSCYYIESIDLSDIDLSSVNNFTNMFSGCGLLSSFE